MIQLTAHAKNRIKQRCGIRKGAERIAGIAFEKGLTIDDLSGNLKHYVMYLYTYNYQANNIRLYGDKIYVFCNDVLVTVLDTPRKYLSIVKKDMKRRNDGQG
ncbi:MAG: hypothetical protein ABFD25_00940 [Clostridiaceae bacterium]